MNTLQDKIGALSEEARGWLLGTKSENPLGCAFTKKRVVHPGAGGKRMIMDKAEQAQIWAELMAQTPDPADERAVYIHIPFCDKKCSYCGFFQNFTREEAAHHYVDVLMEELDAAADTPYVMGAPFQAVFFGGAGMSTESGIPDFRSAGGIYSETLHREFAPEQMASHSFLMAHPAAFFAGVLGVRSMT